MAESESTDNFRVSVWDNIALYVTKWIPSGEVRCVCVCTKVHVAPQTQSFITERLCTVYYDGTTTLNAQLHQLANL